MDDRAEITDLVYRYGRGFDDRDVAAVISCVAEDAVVSLNNGEIVLRGVDDLRRWLEDAFAPGGPLAPGVRSTHIMANVLVEIAGDRGRAETTAVFYRIDAGIVVVRGVSYSDVCERRGGRWRIVRRDHRPVWQGEMAGRAV